MVGRTWPVVRCVLSWISRWHMPAPIARLGVALIPRLRLPIRRGHVRLLVDIHSQFIPNSEDRAENRGKKDKKKVSEKIYIYEVLL